MRKHRAAVLVAGTVLAGVSAGVPGSAVADERERPAPSYRMVEEAPTGPPLFLGPARRTIFSDVVVKSGRPVLRGDVSDYRFGEVVVQRKACDTCSWRRHEKVVTGGRGWFRSTISAPRTGSTFWRAKVAPSDGYERSFSAVWETYY
jgi:hypothetical protein